MRHRRLPLLALFLFAGAMAGYGLYHGLGTPAESVTVLDCRNASFTCNRTEITRRPATCEGWHPWDLYEDLDCTYTRTGLDRVSLVADPANYIEVPLTGARYTESTLIRQAAPMWDLEPLPSGALLWTGRLGSVNIYRNGTATTVDTLGVLSTETVGLLGLAIHPRFAENGYVYLYYTTRRTGERALFRDASLVENRVSRFTLTASGLSNETVLLTLPGSDIHSGGRLEFGPDGYLYVTTGDADMVYEAANASFLGGKILRLNPDGSVPADNPFNDSYVYSMGHRNPQGLAWHPGTADLYAAEHGEWRHDEINRIVPGGNYGWPQHRCGERMPQYWEGGTANTPPVFCFADWTLAPSGMAFVDEPGHPWYGDLFVAGLRGKQVFRLRFEDGEPASGEVFYTSAERPGVGLRLRDVEFHEGSLYVVGDEGGIVRITPAG